MLVSTLRRSDFSMGKVLNIFMWSSGNVNSTHYNPKFEKKKKYVKPTMTSKLKLHHWQLVSKFFLLFIHLSKKYWLSCACLRSCVFSTFSTKSLLSSFSLLSWPVEIILTLIPLILQSLPDPFISRVASNAGAHKRCCHTKNNEPTGRCLCSPNPPDFNLHSVWLVTALTRSNGGLTEPIYRSDCVFTVHGCLLCVVFVSTQSAWT